ncbi:MAG: histidine kinase [Lachnospiraceae bacterium]|jgi:two-component system LytT family sensor kinase|nr:histidine kinase [Lachnospiraceae bacterium]
MITYIKKQWLKFSLSRKLGVFSVLIVFVMGISVFFNIQVVNFSLGSFYVVLDDNSRCYAFQEALETEIKAFERLIREQSGENLEQYATACANTEQRMNALPYDYSKIGSERYARTWNIINSYENYKEFREQVIEESPFETSFIPNLYQVYGMQDYLQDYARRLLSATLTEGMDVYQDNASVFLATPYAILLFSAIVLAVAMVLTKILSRTLVSPLVMLAECSRKMEKNDFGWEDLVTENGDEVGELVLSFNKMKHAMEAYINTLKENNEMAMLLHKEELEKIEMEKRLNAAKLEFLKSQINPHFLFNTLNMISCMAKLEDAATTEKMITSMSSLFRYNLKTEEQIVPLQQELKIAWDYIYIQQMRFGSRIQYSCSLEVDKSEVMIPSFTLQPLIENAIVHGLSKKEQGGRLFLRIWKQGGAVRISVADTGQGMSEVKKEQLVAALKEHATETMGIGLGNIYQRIHAMYQGGEVKIYSKEGRGTVIQITVPQGEAKAAGY